MHHVGEARLAHRLQHRPGRGVAGEVLRPGVVEQLGEREPVPGAVEAGPWDPSSAVDHEAAQRLDRGPAGERVVADVEEAARLELGGGERDDGLALGGADPAQHAVRAEVVEGGERLAPVEEALEVALQEADVGEAGAARHAAREGDVLGVDVDADEPRAGVGGREGHRGVAGARAELAVVEVGRGWGREAVERGGQAEAGGAEVVDEVAQVRDVGDVLFRGRRRRGLRCHRRGR